MVFHERTLAGILQDVTFQIWQPTFQSKYGLCSIELIQIAAVGVIGDGAIGDIAQWQRRWRWQVGGGDVGDVGWWWRWRWWKFATWRWQRRWRWRSWLDDGPLEAP